MVDIGCGPGGQVGWARSMGIINAIGIDGDPALPVRDWIVRHDFTTGTPLGIQHGVDTGAPLFDLAWSVEFLEHLEEKYLPNVMPLFARCEYAIVTAAPPGKGGHHHVNCQDWVYWATVFQDYGLRLDPGLTKDVRESSSMEREFMRENGLVFVNERPAMRRH